MPALGVQDLQGAYDSGTGDITLAAANGPLRLIDNAAPIGNLLEIQDNTPDTILAVAPTTMTFGPSARRFLQMNWPDSTGAMSTEVFPDDFSITTATGTNAVFFTSAARTITLAIPGGAPFGNDAAPAFANFQHTVRFADPGNIFASQLLVNAAVAIECAAAVGPIYLFLDQYRTYADGAAFVCTQHNAMRAQPRWGPNINGGSITQTSAELYFATVAVDATVGTASITTLNYFAAKAPSLVAGGTIGTLTAFDIANIPAAGITTIRGINSAMASGTFIRQAGVAPSEFAGDVHMNDGVSLVLGTPAAVDRVELLRSSAGVARFIGVNGGNNEGVDLDLEATANVAEWSSSTGAGFKWSPSGAADAAATLVLGDGLDPDGTSNWWLAWSPGARTVNLAGDWFDILFSPAANVDLAGNAMGTVATVEFLEPGITLSGGSVVTAATVFIANAPTEGTTNNNALRVGSGLTSLDDLEIRAGSFLDYNEIDALGGGAAATLGTIGGTGPTAAAQATWMEISIAGVAHWVALWV